MKGLNFNRRVTIGLCLLLAVIVVFAIGTSYSPQFWKRFWSEDNGVVLAPTQPVAETIPITDVEEDPDEEYTPEVGQEGKDVVWVPTQDALVETMLNMANVTASDFVIDLGAGDGRIVIAAAKRGATALGIEYNQDLVEFSRRLAIEEGVSEKATFEKADIFESDFSSATVITMFLLPELNLELRPTILDMKPGTRVVSNTFDMADWEPDETRTVTENSTSGFNTAYLWIVPAKVQGKWQLDNGEISFMQDFQNVTGVLTIEENNISLTGKIDGDKISFIAGDSEYSGIIVDDTISGTIDGGDFWKATR